MTQLGAITLTDYLRLRDYHRRPLRAGSTRFLCGGGHVHQSVSLTEGHLYLEGYREGNGLYGYFTGAQVQAIEALYISGEVVSFTHPLGSWQVKVIERDFSPVSRRVDPQNTDYFLGTITLLIQ